MTEVPGTDRDEARENVREETPLVPEDVEGDEDAARPRGDEGVTGDDAKPPSGGTDPVP
ncbi:hypothetical protein [Blastococcus saxobsidens]|uniref:Uncharacterized protein n=1 Tax=Blastococcus saxobsidens (strain DD2) TaxID=1146883 RepID=H6RK97_BLASD|nr:hypothetical protein [Blastococcus saxobsidens]CCG01120.1 conserved protein of unknown function [Blastococcus saxobsidens DD2]